MTLCVKALSINECVHIQTGAEIEDQSCNGGRACVLSPGIVVEEGSCNVSEEDDYDMCALAPGAHIGKESCIGDYGEVLLKFSIVALINSLCIYLNSFSFHQSPLKVCAKRDGECSTQSCSRRDGLRIVHDLILSPLL
jgi:hypothetical protein